VESSTASETAGSNSDGHQAVGGKASHPESKLIKQPKSNIETPKSKKMNPWMAQR
jgi:hypothetical protein